MWEKMLAMADVPTRTRSEVMHLIDQGLDLHRYMRAPVDPAFDISTVSGVELSTASQFISRGLPPRMYIPSPAFVVGAPGDSTVHGSKAAFAKAEIKKWAASGAIHPIKRTNAHMVLPVFVVANSKSLRLVYDASPANVFFEQGTMSYPNLNQFTAHLHATDWLWSLDYKTAYHSLKVNKASRKFVCFEADGQLWAFHSAPFGLNMLCRIFQMLADCTAAFARRILRLIVIAYLDDMGGNNIPTPAWMAAMAKPNPSATDVAAAKHALATLAAHGRAPLYPHDCQSPEAYTAIRAHDGAWVMSALAYVLGFTTSRGKSHLHGSKILPLLGLHVNLKRMGYDVPPPKLERVLRQTRELLSFDCTDVRAMQRYTGYLQSLVIVAPTIAVYLRYLYNAMSLAGYDDMSAIVDLTTDDVRQSLTALLNLKGLAEFHSWIIERHVPVALYTDAEPGGLGSLLHMDGTEHWWQMPVPGASANTPAQPIHIVEGVALKCSLSAHAHMTRGRWIDIYTDNELLRYALRKGTSRKDNMHRIVHAIYEELLANGNRWQVMRVPTKVNVVADVLSRTVGHGPMAAAMQIQGIRSPDAPQWELSLSRTAFAIVEAFCVEMSHTTFTVDVCADELNRKLRRFYALYYCTVDGAVGQNALAHNLALSAEGMPEVCYCFPPVIMITAMWKHLRECGAKGVIIVPDNAALPWFSSIHALALGVRQLTYIGAADMLVRTSLGAAPRNTVADEILLMAYFDFSAPLAVAAA